MSWCRWVTDKAYDTVNYAYSWTDYLLLSPLKLKPITKAIYYSGPFSNFCQGFGQITRLPEVFSISNHTKQIITKSFTTNVYALLNAIAIERLVHKAYPEYTIIYSDTLATIFDWTIFIGFTARYVARKWLENNCWSLSLPYAVSNDLVFHLAKEYSHSLTDILWDGFKDNFSFNVAFDGKHAEQNHRKSFENNLRKHFEEFIAQREIKAQSFKKLKNNLGETIYECIEKAGFTDSKSMLDKFSKQLAYIIVNEFFNAILVAVPRVIPGIKDDFVKALSSSNDNLNDKEFLVHIAKRLLNKKDPLSTSLPYYFLDNGSRLFLNKISSNVKDMQATLFLETVKARRNKDIIELSATLTNSNLLSISRAKNYANSLVFLISKTNADAGYILQRWMPLSNVSECGCEKKKKIHASLSTILYYSGNLLWLAILRRLFLALPETYDTQKALGLIALYNLRAIIFGQSVNEYKVVGDGQCTRHRYQIFAQNKAHSLGVGLSYTLSVELIAICIKYLTEVDNLFTRDAISNFILQLVIIATLSNNKSLPGKGYNSWDVLFAFPRELTLKTAEALHSRFIMKFNDVASRQRGIDRVKAIISSTEMSLAVKYLLEGNDYFPNVKIYSEIKEYFNNALASEQEVHKLSSVNEPIMSKREWLLQYFQNKLDNEYEQVVLPVNTQNKSDPFITIFHYHSVNDLLTLYQKNIDSLIRILANAHAFSKEIAGPLLWLVDPLLWLPLPSAFASFITMPLLILRDEALYDVVRRLQAQMAVIRVKNLNNNEDEKPVVSRGQVIASSHSTAQDKIEQDIKEATSVPMKFIPPPLDQPLSDEEYKRLLAPVKLAPLSHEYQESDLNIIPGLEYNSMTPHTARQSKVSESAVMRIYGVFACSRSENIVYQPIKKTDAVELRRF